MFGLVAGGCSSFSNLLELTDLFSKKKKKKKTIDPLYTQPSRF